MTARNEQEVARSLMVLLAFALMSLVFFRPYWFLGICGFLMFVAAAWTIRFQLRIRSIKNKLSQHSWQICPECEFPLVQGERWLKCNECGKEFETWEAPRDWRETLYAMRQHKFVKESRSMKDQT